MERIYASLIIKGPKTINDVPPELKDEVRAILNSVEGGTPM